MHPSPSAFKESLSSVLDELLTDVEQIKSLLSLPNWKKIVSEPNDTNDVVLSRIVFDLGQANDHLLKTREKLAVIVSSEK